MSALHLLKRTSKRAKQRVGRGQGSGRGKQSGRGGKGQTARAGNKRRPEWRDIIKKLPKRRGYGKNRGRTVDGTKLDAVAVSLERLSDVFEAGSDVNVKTLIEKGVLHARHLQPVKIVGGGELSKKLTVTGIPVSASARAAIEKAGGSAAAFVSAGAAQAVRDTKAIRQHAADKKART